MVADGMYTQVARAAGFIAALDQSGGSTPGALRQYGIPDDAYADKTEMFKLMHAMRTRLMTAPSFDGRKVLGAILFEQTMDGQVEGNPVPGFLWHERHVVPFVKVDQGLEEEADGVRLMKPMPGLDDLLQRAQALGVFGTKMRSVIARPSSAGIAAIVEQQFDIGLKIASRGLMPIIEPEVLLTSQNRAGAEAILLSELRRKLDTLRDDIQVMLKLTLPTVPNLYAELIGHPRVLRVVALSGGYSRADACAHLAANKDMIASFSRALTEGLTRSMSDEAFNAALSAAIGAIYQASTVKG